MTTFSIKQKMFAFGDDFSIKDSHGDEVYYVDGKAFSFGADLSILNKKKEKIARIRQALMAMVPTYYIYKGDALIGTVKKKLFTFRPQFKILTKLEKELLIVGNFVLFDYTFYRENKVVASASKRIIAMTDSYGVEVSPGEDEILILASAIVVDLVLHPKHKKS